MIKINRILLPVDFQDTSKRVVHQATVLARHFNSEIVMLHVVTPLSYSAGMLEGRHAPANLADLLKELLRLAQRNLDEALKPELNGLTVKRMLVEGDPARTIVRTVRDEKVDLIAMPTHGYGAFRRFLWDLLHPKCYTTANVQFGLGPIWKKGQRASLLFATSFVRSI